jgi:ADP-heptose:LPS heptosyltransferase
MTWPVVRAIKRNHPGAEIHMLVRHRFEGATIGLSELDQVHVLPNRMILEPLVHERPDLEASCCRLESFLDGLQGYQFDEVINFSFSPLSSYLTHYMQSWGVQAVGFTRHSDGYLNFADEVSAFFHAQVGPDKANRCHLSDIFASMLGMTLEDSDWQTSVPDSGQTAKSFVLHIGASEKHKRLTQDEYAQLVQGLYQNYPDHQIVLIGSKEEQTLGDYIKQRIPVPQVANLVGKTELQDLFQIIAQAEMFIGCDSGPMHIASLTNTMTFNISLGNVNFWETGPKAHFSYIAQLPQHAEMRDMKSVLGQISGLLKGVVASSLVVRGGGIESYQIPSEGPDSQFAWKLVQAMYLGGNYPVLDNFQVYQGLKKIQEVNQLLLEQYELVTKDAALELNEVVTQADQILQSISRNAPALRPIIDWMMTEKIRISPAQFEQVKADTLRIHQNLSVMLKHYIIPEAGIENGSI